MNILCDYHHGNLYYSLHLLFENRLGYKMFRPIGLDWFMQGYFKIAQPYGDAPDTINQYLAIDSRKWDSYKSLNGDYKLQDNIYHIFDPENNIEHKAITFETFKQMQFDYIIASHPLHTNWQELLQYQPKAKFIAQLGNEGQVTNATNVLSSIGDYPAQPHQKVMKYHQEFDLSEYCYEPPTNHTKVSSFVVLLPERETFLQYKAALPEMDFKAYGPGAIDGIIGNGEGISKEMRSSAFGFHVKPGGDGYGHVIHKWAASGRPLIIRGSYYQGKMAEPLIKDGITAIDLDKHSFEENIALIRYWSQPENHKKMCENVINNFRAGANFDTEAKQIKDWLSII